MSPHQLVLGLAFLVVVAVAIRLQYNHVTAKVTDGNGAGYSFPVATPLVSPLCPRPSDCKFPLIESTPSSRGVLVP